MNALFQSASRVVQHVPGECVDRRAQALFVLVHCAIGTAFAVAAILVLALNPAHPALAGGLLMAGCICVALSVVLTRSGKLFAMRAASTVALAALVVGISVKTDGAAAGTLVLLALAPLEAARVQERRLVKMSVAIAATAIVALGLFHGFENLSTTFLTAGAVVVYVAWFALAMTAPRSQPQQHKAEVAALPDISVSEPHCNTIARPGRRFRKTIRTQLPLTPRPANPAGAHVTPYGSPSVSPQFCVQEGDCRVR